MATNPLILDAQNIKRLPVPDLSTMAAMPSATPTLPAAPAPNVVRMPDPATQNTGLRLLGDQTELKRLGDTGSGVSQIKNPLLRGLARVGDVAESILAPGAAAFTPGTTLNHQRLVDRQTGLVNNDLANQQEQANTTLLDAQPQLKQMAAENNMLKTQGYLQHVGDQGQHYQDQNTTALRNHGYTIDETDPTGQKVRPLRYEEMSEPQQAVEDLKHAQLEQADAQAALKKAQNDPTSPAFKLAQGRLNVAQQNANTALGRLGLQGQSLQLRQQNTNASLYGTDNQGNALPGSAQITGDDGQQTTVGAKFAPNAIKQQKSIGSFNDLHGSVGHTRDSLNKFFAEGGSLSDPRIVEAMSDPNSTIGKVINGTMVQGGLSPAAIEAINSVRQLHEQAGILRSTTGGTSSEAGAQRILDVVPGAGDSNAVALQKLEEQERVLGRLAPGQTHVAGGLSVKNGSGNAPNTGGGETIPAAAAAQLKEGQNHTFNNGQTWTKQNGKPVRVK